MSVDRRTFLGFMVAAPTAAVAARAPTLEVDKPIITPKLAEIPEVQEAVAEAERVIPEGASNYMDAGDYVAIWHEHSGQLSIEAVRDQRLKIVDYSEGTVHKYKGVPYLFQVDIPAGHGRLVEIPPGVDAFEIWPRDMFSAIRFVRQ